MPQKTSNYAVETFTQMKYPRLLWCPGSIHYWITTAVIALWASVSNIAEEQDPAQWHMRLKKEIEWHSNLTNFKRDNSVGIKR